ncbi:ribosome maturation factor RimM [Amphibacillus xylanus]|uniref:Ribosome maturation factor RimM n=1 Tax=Amphibacillus xylanus (strain ATCC 51415 / DSM 6626 / JCM 7361 / LMG 17667 / NBRC 15112 / Ep01) TaxID=698758 RepID=K0IYY0_AMPXN|nr:ribosome maturation factor RimM [Amphibacillus xylanus]BAM47654.1 ribosome maturation factor RimM [Amphibacillus xylanus NBRC 15112]
MEFFNVGKIVNTHGIKGEVKVVRITDFDQRFQPGNQLYLFLPNQTTPIKLMIERHRKHKQFDMLTFKGYYSINDVEHFKQGMLKISEADLHPLEEGSYYYHEIIGCEVVTTSGEKLGPVAEVLAPGANDVWVVKRKNQKDLLIPYIDDIVKEVNIEQKQITIEPMEGLLS